MKPKSKPHKNPPKEPKKPDSYQIEKHIRNFCSYTSEEFGKTLGTIIGELDYALSTQNQAARDHSMAVALSATEKSLHLAKNLKYFAEHTQLKLVPVDLSEMILETADQIEQILENRKIQLKVMAESPATTLVDVNSMQHVLLNLAQNAIQSMPMGGELFFSLRKDKQYLEITFSDTGEGLSDNEVEMLFTPYYLSQKIHPLGFDGLTLTVSLAVVEAHGGFITVQSKKNEGSTFTIHLPLDPSLSGAPQYSHKRRFRRVMLQLPAELHLEGQPVIRTTLRTLSERGGYLLFPTLPRKERPNRNDSGFLTLSYFFGQSVTIQRIRVASTKWSGSLPGIGVEFIEMDGKTKKILLALIKSHAP